MPSSRHPIANPVAVAGTLKSLDEEIEKMQEILVRLKTTRNDLLPVARIPPELLSEIFLCFRDSSTRPSREYVQKMSWISITHVCARWRNVALADPRLWNTINLRFPDLADYFLNYSGMLPLRVVLSQLAPYRRGVLECREDFGLDATCSNPIASIDICTFDEEAIHCLVEFLPSAGSTLTSLEIWLDECEDVINVLEDTCLPNLHTLRLNTVDTDMTCMRFKSCSESLRVLELCRCYFSDWAVKDFAQFSSLQRLQLLWSCENIKSDNEDPEVGELPSLVDFHLADTPDACLGFLRRLKLPPDCHTLIRPCDLGTPLVQWTELLDALLSIHTPDSASVKVGSDIITFEFGHTRGTPRILRFSIRHNESLWMLARLPASTVELAITSDPSIDIVVSALERLTQSCASTRLLELSGSSIITAMSEYLCNHPKSFEKLAVMRVCTNDFASLPQEVVKGCRDGVAARDATLVEV